MKPHLGRRATAAHPAPRLTKPTPLSTPLPQDSLGGNTKTVMVANLGPADWNYDETISTLRYANRAKNIKNKPKINEDPKDAMLREFQEEIARLKAALGEGPDEDTARRPPPAAPPRSASPPTPLAATPPLSRVHRPVPPPPPHPPHPTPTPPFPSMATPAALCPDALARPPPLCDPARRDLARSTLTRTAWSASRTLSRSV